jgi:hypothetical protein
MRHNARFIGPNRRSQVHVSASGAGSSALRPLWTAKLPASLGICAQRRGYGYTTATTLHSRKTLGASRPTSTHPDGSALSDGSFTKYTRRDSG